MKLPSYLRERVAGFTGTQHGMEIQQSRMFLHVLRWLRPTGWHHGDCVGSDAESHRFVQDRSPTTELHVHPPNKVKKRAYCLGDVLHARKDYLPRNDDIVQLSDYLVATPRGPEKDNPRSGTWYTIRQARRTNKPIIILWPSGKVTFEPTAVVQASVFSRRK